MRAIATAMSFASLLLALGASAQNTAQLQVINASHPAPETTSPDYSARYCSGFVTDERIPSEVHIMSGQESGSKIVFSSNDYVYINRGSAQGVRVGDRYSVVRPDKDPNEVHWFKWQEKLLKAMGTQYVDAGQVQVTTVEPNSSIAIVKFSCDYLQRGDIALPMTERPSPPYKPAEKFNDFAPVSGKSVGMVVSGREFTQTYGKNSTVYVNLGASQGVRVGDYLRVFRYEGSAAEFSENFPDYQYTMYGFGSTPVKYKWNDIPRNVIGEGIVMNVTRNACAVFITYSKLTLYAGDYVEIE
jgi:hypothetical protein